MKLHSPVRSLCCLLAAALLLSGAFSRPALAAEPELDTEREGSIVLSLFYEGEPVSGGDLLLFRVGEVVQTDGGGFFRLADALGAGLLDQEALDDPDLAGRLAGDSGLKTLAYRSADFGADGTAAFSGLKPGLYLLTQSRAAEGFELISPILVSVPYYVAGEGYVYDVDASVKPAVARQAEPLPSPTAPVGTEPPLPRTGQLKWPVPVMAGLGLCFVLAGLSLFLADRRRPER